MLEKTREVAVTIAVGTSWSGSAAEPEWPPKLAGTQTARPDRRSRTRSPHRRDRHSADQDRNGWSSTHTIAAPPCRGRTSGAHRPSSPGPASAAQVQPRGAVRWSSNDALYRADAWPVLCPITPLLLVEQTQYVLALLVPQIGEEDVGRPSVPGGAPLPSAAHSGTTTGVPSRTASAAATPPSRSATQSSWADSSTSSRRSSSESDVCSTNPP